MSKLHSRYRVSIIIVIVVLISSYCCTANGFPQSDTAKKPALQPPSRTQTAETLFVPPDKSFTILMPHTPQKEQLSTASSFGPIIYHLYTATDQKAQYSIGYADYPADKYKRVSPEKLLDIGVDTTRKKYGKGLIKDEKITYQSFSGRELLINVDVPAKVQVNMRYFLVKNRMYTVAVEHLQSTSMMAEATKYMNGLKILK